MDDQTFNDNVFIFGAGFSYDAKIPLLSNFIKTMLDFYQRKKNEIEDINPDDLIVLERALKIRNDLDGYHGRVFFNDRNIEDILSMLSFNVLDDRRNYRKLNSFITAIARTIEIACEVKHEGFQANNQYRKNESGSQLYRDFWVSLFNLMDSTKTIPSIISLNYDLVLERSLFQVLINTIYNHYETPVPFRSFCIDYNYKYFTSRNFEIQYTQFGSGYGLRNEQGSIIKAPMPPIEKADLTIDILKLHGSLNFPTSNSAKEKYGCSYTDVIDEPYIIPPISNKTTGGYGESIWKNAISRLRNAKNVIFVGYSLPITDTYMQFFLKAALGPNKVLDSIYIFDPLLWNDNIESEKMKKRYEDCFSLQLRERICFNPPFISEKTKGTAYNFVEILSKDPSSILY